MGEPLLPVSNQNEQEKEETKLLGAHVDESIYWLFKGEAAKRKDTMADAIKHAALLYIDAGKVGKKNDD